MSQQLFLAIDLHDEVACRNLRMNDGCLASITASGRRLPGLPSTGWACQAVTREATKEWLLETVRAREFAGAPSRVGAIHLFESATDAALADSNWWQERQVILSAEIVFATRVGCFDIHLLDVTADRWERAARAYWAAQRSSFPQYEVLVDGVVRLLGWERYANALHH